jgi:hypothetical protein
MAFGDSLMMFRIYQKSLICIYLYWFSWVLVMNVIAMFLLIFVFGFLELASTNHMGQILLVRLVLIQKRN